MAALTDRGLIGQRMVEASLLANSQLEELLRYQQEDAERVPLGRLSVSRGMVRDEEFAPFLASYFNAPYMSLGLHVRIKQDVLDVIPEGIARRYNVLPLFVEMGTLFVAMEDPVDIVKIENLSIITGLAVKPVVSPATQIAQRIDDFYGTDVYRSLEEGEPEPEAQTEGRFSPNAENYNRRIAASFVNILLERAFKSGVSIIHIQPDGGRVKAFFRIDNRLEKIASYPGDILKTISGYLKEASGMDAAKSDIPQAGSFDFRLNKKSMEIGVSIYPTLDGERIVLEAPRRLF